MVLGRPAADGLAPPPSYAPPQPQPPRRGLQWPKGFTTVHKVILVVGVCLAAILGITFLARQKLLEVCEITVGS